MGVNRGANNFVQPIFGVGGNTYVSFVFFLHFLSSNANNIHEHVNTKYFVIETVFWEKWCII